MADWVASLVANHSSEVLWTHLGDAPSPFRDIILSDFLGCIQSRIVGGMLWFTKKKALVALPLHWFPYMPCIASFLNLKHIPLTIFLCAPMCLIPLHTFVPCFASFFKHFPLKISWHKIFSDGLSRLLPFGVFLHAPTFSLLAFGPYNL